MAVWYTDAHVDTPGQDIGFVLRKFSYTTGRGDFWDETAGAFVSSFTAQCKIQGTEDPTADGIYYAASSDIGDTYTGHMIETPVTMDAGSEARSGVTSKMFYCRNGQKQSVQESVTPLSPDQVGKARTWFALPQEVTCREVVECTTSDTAVYSMDFSKALNGGVSISSASSVTDQSGNSLTVSGTTLSKDKLSVHFTVTGSNLTALTDYLMRVTVVSTDGDTFARQGKLRCVA